MGIIDLVSGMNNAAKQMLANVKWSEMKWDNFFSPLTIFKDNRTNFLFAQSEKDCKILYSLVTSKGEGILLQDVKWLIYYNILFTFTEKGKNYLFGYSSWQYTTV